MPEHASTGNPFNQPRAAWAVPFACVISFMGIGLVDPILPSLALPSAFAIAVVTSSVNASRRCSASGGSSS